MTRQNSIYRFRSALVALTALLGTGIASSASAIDWGREAHREDSRTCESFGADHGREYTRCMMEQQRRRDDALLDASEQQRNNAEAARNNVETVRRMRCNREAERARARGERPEWCR
ncbi:hypothetical protein EHI44_31435 [Rhizobium leguminosarum]|uniref:hypothetical protein n=1 Tax=Rhizobium leguminosarum TaxID=384 RepID=UPI000FF499EA|nr:hypothetical protein [Rhizobium leguminosarum]RWY79095.1 hypothetical protein EHI44_31435 [Rhizobium leguminosarum]